MERRAGRQTKQWQGQRQRRVLRVRLGGRRDEVLPPNHAARLLQRPEHVGRTEFVCHGGEEKVTFGHATSILMYIYTHVSVDVCNEEKSKMFRKRDELAN